MLKKDVTIEKLARMTQDEFSRLGASVDERFDAVDARFDKMDKRFDKMDVTLKTILDVVLELPTEKAIVRLDDRVQNVEARLTSVERRTNKSEKPTGTS